MNLRCKTFIFALTVLISIGTRPALSQPNADPGAELPPPNSQSRPSVEDSGNTDMDPAQEFRKRIMQRRKQRQAAGSGNFAGSVNFAGRQFGPAAGLGRGQGFGIMGRHQLDLTPLNLTEQQKEKIQQSRETNKAKAKELRQSFLQKQLEFRSLMFSADATETQIRKARKELRQFQDQIDELALNDFLSIRSTLTDEQRKHLPDLIPQKRKAAQPH